MKHRALLATSLGILAVGLACRSSPGPTDAAMASDGQDRTVQRDVKATEAVPAEMPVIDSTGTSSVLQQKVRSVPVYPPNAFPPSLPGDSFHEGAWARDDCMLCHEDGVGEAPVVQHAGMSRLLLSGRCRTCHVPMGSVGADEVLFPRNAFPPTLPTDESHAGAWYQSDCLRCHAAGTEGAPQLLHRGMTPILRSVRCRTCHVPSAH